MLLHGGAIDQLRAPHVFARGTCWREHQRWQSSQRSSCRSRRADQELGGSSSVHASLLLCFLFGVALSALLHIEGKPAVGVAVDAALVAIAALLTIAGEVDEGRRLDAELDSLSQQQEKVDQVSWRSRTGR